MQDKTSLESAKRQDEARPLKNMRRQFLIPVHQGREAIYFLGNSLGLQSKSTEEYIHRVLNQWAAFGVEGFFCGDEPWMDAHRQLVPALSEIVGALPHEVVVMNQLTVNLHLMLASFYRPEGRRKKILCEAKAFPSDQYALHTHVQQRGYNPEEVIIEVGPRDGGDLISEEDLISAIGEHSGELALVLWGGVNYYSGQVFDLASITRAAHAAGAKAGFDLAHAAGNVPLRLHDWDVDFACWCGYKYLNSGPGAIAGCFIHERFHHEEMPGRLAGWWGNKKETRFIMRRDFEPEQSAEGWQLSTPSPLLFACHKAALDLFSEAGIPEVFAENKRLNDYLRDLLKAVREQVPAGALQIVTPEDRAARGCQVSVSVRKGKEVFGYLSEHGVYADWREPDVIRIAPVALYNTFEEVWQFSQLLKKAIIKFSS